MLGNQTGAGLLEIPAKAEAVARATPLRAGQRAFPVQMLLWEECWGLSCRGTVTLRGSSTHVAVAFLEQCGVWTVPHMLLFLSYELQVMNVLG